MNMLDDLIGWARSKGRVGGAVLTVLGLAFLGAGIALFQGGWNAEGDVYYPAIMGGAIVLDLLGVALAMFGGTLLWKGEEGVVIDRVREADPETVQRVFERLDSEQPPYFVCTRCPRVLPVTCAGTCPECGTTAECVEVRGPEDVPLVKAAIG